MFPFVLAGSQLHVRAPVAGALRVGQVVCFLGRDGQFVAHRIVRIERDGAASSYCVRGDAQEQSERIDAAAIAYVVQRVEHRFLSYDTDGWFGRKVAALAVRRGAPYRLLRGCMSFAVKARRALLPEAPSSAALGPQRAPKLQPSAVSLPRPPRTPMLGLAGAPAESSHDHPTARVAAAVEAMAMQDAPLLLTTASPGHISDRERRELASIFPPATDGALDAAHADRHVAFLRSVSHELRTPLNAILGFTDVLLAEIDGPLTPDQRENLTIVRESGKRLLWLVNEVIELSALVPQSGVSAGEPVLLVTALEGLREQLEERRGVRPVHVRVAVAQDAEAEVLASSAFTKALAIFAELALASTESGEVLLGARLEDGEPCCIVSGDGLRITAQDLQVDVRGDRASRLRLLIAKQIVELAGGVCEVRALPSPGDADGAHAAEDARDAHDAPAARETPASAFFVRCARAGAQQAATASLPAQAAQALRVQWLAAMGHDLRTPLNAILGFADLIALDARSGLSAQQRRSLEIVRERARDLLALIDDVVDWAKLEAGELVFSAQPEAVQALVQAAVQRAKERSGARTLQVHTQLDADLGSVHVDAARLVQALVALMDHATRSMHGSVTLRAKRASGSSSGPASPRRVQLELHDAQLEIREVDQAHVFTAFRPSFAPTGKRIAGLSLGTALARGLLRAQGGDVWFASRPERGTTFVVTLPLVEPSAAPHAAPGPGQV